MLGRKLAGVLFGLGIALLYGLLYALLQMEQNALVIGSVMLFAALAAVMMLTRRIDWYALFARLRAERRASAARAGAPRSAVTVHEPANAVATGDAARADRDLLRARGGDPARGAGLVGAAARVAGAGRGWRARAVAGTPGAATLACARRGAAGARRWRCDAVGA